MQAALFVITQYLTCRRIFSMFQWLVLLRQRVLLLRLKQYQKPSNSKSELSFNGRRTYERYWWRGNGLHT